MIFGKGERLLFFRFEDGEDFIDAFVQDPFGKWA